MKVAIFRHGERQSSCRKNGTFEQNESTNEGGDKHGNFQACSPKQPCCCDHKTGIPVLWSQQHGCLGEHAWKLPCLSPPSFVLSFCSKVPFFRQLDCLSPWRKMATFILHSQN